MAMSRINGRAITSAMHLQQSINDILTTPIGSRVMRREYGSLIPDLIDQPLIGATVLRVYAAAAAALMRWEPRIRVTNVKLEIGSTHGAAVLDVGYTVKVTGERRSSTVALRAGASS